jgi:L-alanine-DL-glutamate epimerase-like enolase superfamily enzyme
VRITAIAFERLALPLDPPFRAAWDPVPRTTFEATLVRVETDEGLVGIGSGDAMDGLRAYAHLFLGEDPLRLARHARTLETIELHAGRPWPLEAALWDLAGQALGVPVATLLGGAIDRLPAYASLGELRSPEARAEDALALRERGFRALKVRVARDRAEEGVAVVAAIRAAVGDEMEICVDLNQWWRMPGDITPGLSVPAARRIVEALAEQRVAWVEEPLPGADLGGMRALRDSTGVAIAGGEMARTYDELLAAHRADALDVFQPDVVLALGISRTRTLAELVLAGNRRFTPHTWSNGIGLLANLHVVCGVGGGPWVEFPYDPPAWTPERRDFMLAEPVEVDGDGCLRIPPRPGLGIVLDADGVAFHATGERELVR